MTKDFKNIKRCMKKSRRKIKDYRLFFLQNWTSSYNICTK